MFKVGQVAKVNMAALDKALMGDPVFSKHFNGFKIERIDEKEKRVFFGSGSACYFNFSEILNIRRYKITL